MMANVVAAGQQYRAGKGEVAMGASETLRGWLTIVREEWIKVLVGGAGVAGLYMLGTMYITLPRIESDQQDIKAKLKAQDTSLVSLTRSMPQVEQKLDSHTNQIKGLQDNLYTVMQKTGNLPADSESLRRLLSNSRDLRNDLNANQAQLFQMSERVKTSEAALAALKIEHTKSTSELGKLRDDLGRGGIPSPSRLADVEGRLKAQELQMARHEEALAKVRVDQLMANYRIRTVPQPVSVEDLYSAVSDFGRAKARFVRSIEIASGSPRMAVRDDFGREPPSWQPLKSSTAYPLVNQDRIADFFTLTTFARDGLWEARGHDLQYRNGSVVTLIRPSNDIKDEEVKDWAIEFNALIKSMNTVKLMKTQK